MTGALRDYGLPVLDARITQRISYPNTAATGTTVLDAEPDSVASDEVKSLFRELAAFAGLTDETKAKLVV